MLAEMGQAAPRAIATLPESDLVELARLAADAGRDDILRALGLAALAAGLPGRARAIAGMAGEQAMTAGLALLGAGRGAAAGIAFEMALAAAPADPAAQFNAAFAALAAGDHARAAALLAALPACGAAEMARAAWPPPRPCPPRRGCRASAW